MKSTKVAELKASSLLSIGRLCRKMGAHLSYRIDDLVEVLSSVLLTKMKMRGVPSEALKCISDMVCGMGKYLWGFSTYTLTHILFLVGVSFHYRVLGLLDAMLHSGLTEDLIGALSVITSNMPMHKELVHRRLLAEIVKVLEEVLMGK